MKYANFKPSHKFLILFSFLVLLFIGLQWGANLKVKSELDKIAHLDFEEVDVDLWNKEISLSGVQIKDLKKPGRTYSVGIRRASIAGLSIWPLLRRGELQAGTIFLDEPYFSVNQRATEVTDSIQRHPDEEDASVFQFDQITLRNGNIRVFKDSVLTLKMDTVDVEVGSFILDRNRDSVNWDCQQLMIRGSGFFMKESGDLHELNVKRFNCSTAGNRLKIEGLTFNSPYSKSNWSEVVKYKEGRLDLYIPGITAEDFDVREAIIRQNVKAGKITIEDAELEVFADANIPVCPDCYKAFPQEKLSRSAIDIAIDTILLRNNKIQVEILAIGEQVPGKLTFTETYASLYNITNQAGKLDQNSTCHIDVQSKFMDEGALEVHFTIPLMDKNYSYGFEGRFSSFDLTELNSLLTFTVNTRIESGKLEKLSFDVSGDNTLAEGQLQFNYRDLKVSLLKDDKREKKKILSGLVNLLVVKEDNLNDKREKKGKMHYPRQPNRSIFHQWSHTLLSGLKSTILPNLLLPDELEVKKK